MGKEGYCKWCRNNFHVGNYDDDTCVECVDNDYYHFYRLNSGEGYINMTSGEHVLVSEIVEMGAKDTNINDDTHPPHYMHGKIECWNWYEQAMSNEEFIGAMKNNIWKYTYRCGHKEDDIQDLNKAINYLKRWIKFINDSKEE